MKVSMIPACMMTMTMASLLCTVMMSVSRPAQAQDLFTTTSTTTSGMITTIGIVWLMMPKDKARSSLTHYMNENQTSMHEALATKQGQALTDLASMSGIPVKHHQRFADALAEALAPHRDALLSPAPYTEAHASILLDAMQQSLANDDVLYEAAQETMRHM